MVMAHQKGIDAAMAYLYEHAGYTRVHNPLTGRKDLQRLPGHCRRVAELASRRAGIAYPGQAIISDRGFGLICVAVRSGISSASTCDTKAVGRWPPVGSNPQRQMTWAAIPLTTT